MSQNIPTGKQQFFDINGNPLVGGKVFNYLVSTTTPKNTYQDLAQTIPNTNPVILDARGQCVMFGTGNYRQVLQDSTGVQIWDQVISDPAAQVSADLSAFIANLANATDAALGDNLVGVKQPVTGSVARTQHKKNADFLSVMDFGALGDGVADDTASIVAATAVGIPVFVPATANFYSLTALTSAQRELLWGPGIIKIAGVVSAIPTAPQTNIPNLPAMTLLKSALNPTNNTPNGSYGEGAINTVVTRTDGFGQYGNWLSQYLVTDSIPPAELDVGITSWVGATNLQGGSVFGAWSGANSPSSGLGQNYTGGGVVGQEINVGNRWGNFGVQTDVGGTRYTVGQQLVPDVLPALDGVGASAVTISVSSPATVTMPSHGLLANMGIVFGGSGTIPVGITPGTQYFVSATGLTASTFQISATIGGASINTSGSSIAPINALPSWAGSFAQVIGQSVHGHQWWVGTLIRGDSIVAGGYGNIARGGNTAGNAPKTWSAVTGFWGNGIDFSGSTFSGGCINFDFANQVSPTATSGGVVSPGNFQAFLKVSVGGTIVKIPYFNN